MKKIDVMIENLIESKKQLGLGYRVWEAASTGAMVLAALCAGGDLGIVMIHLIHWFCSAMYHIYPSPETLGMDVATIRLITIERVSRHHPVAAGLLCAHSIGQLPCGTVEANIGWAIVYAVFGYACFMIDYGFHAIPLIMVMALGLVFWKLSGMMMMRGYLWMGTYLCVLYHALLGLGLYLELILEVRPRGAGSIIVLDSLRYSMWYIYPFFTARSSGFSPFRLQNVASLVASIALTPFGWADTIVLLCGSRSISAVAPRGWFGMQHRMGLFYLVFIIADWILGVVYYPQHFTMLEGCIHHGLTGAVVAEAMISGRSMNGMIAAMVVETSTIVLSLNRVFPSTRTTLLRGIVFPLSFIFTRIVLMSILGILSWREGVHGHAALSVLFGVLNIYWIFKFFSKKTR